MVSFLPSFLIATVFGFLAGMGIGGGSLLLLWLTQVAMMEHTQARMINLLFFLPAAAISTLFRRKQKVVHRKEILPGIFWGCAAALLFSVISTRLDITLLKKLLGVLLICTGLREIFHRRKNAR